ncbi:DNA polymerase II large subunit [Candidatus Micrarchaeota archaeon]|nr:DNA polymerase II large subunit [Candidatus Micrarchaeota archaeon]
MPMKSKGLNRREKGIDMPVCSPAIQQYFDAIEAQFNDGLEKAQTARQKGLDPSTEVEIKPAKDLGARVEGLVGPVGIGKRIRELSEHPREQAAFVIAKEIVSGIIPIPVDTDNENERKEIFLEHAVRTGLAVFTEGVVSAPIEGITALKLKENADGTQYVAVYFSGPIRGAGGTGQAFTLLLADYCRKLLGISHYRATESEVERYVEESNLYAIKTRAGQYVPTEEEIRHIAQSCPVCITGDPTEDYEVNVNKDVPSVETNRVRGGLCLVLSEGICLKATKVLKLSKKAGLNWNWLEPLIKVTKTSAKQLEFKPIGKYIDEIVGGRPILAYPMRPGGFRLRYGRTRFTGIASKAIHPATMALLDGFIAVGTQLKIERPGKGCIATPCERIDGPIVKLKSGEVRAFSNVEEARAESSQVEEILWLGDLLVNYGDFYKANHPLVPSAWCNEWYQMELEEKGIRKSEKEIDEMDASQAFALSKQTGVPLAPKYTFFWHDLSVNELRELANGLVKGHLNFEWFDLKGYSLKHDETGMKTKKLLEKLCVPHRMDNQDIVIQKENAIAVLKTLGILQEKNLSMEYFMNAYSDTKEVMGIVNETAGIPIKKKAGIYVGASMGRPEKAKERKMKPPVHALFPIGNWGGKMRSLLKASEQVRRREGAKIEVNVEVRACPVCGRRVLGSQCGTCNEPTKKHLICSKPTCQRLNAEEATECRHCKSPLRQHELLVIDFANELHKAMERMHAKPHEIKGVQGLISASKTPESLEKGVLRAKYQLSVFRDGTCRFDGTEIPLTHFVPREIGTPIEQLKRLGYTTDRHGKPLENENQVVELMPQDVVVSDYASEYFMRVAQFVDDLLTYHYGIPAYYHANRPEDMIGRLIVSIAPHTSAGILGRIIGVAPARGLMAHPYLHCACRRNADGDEISFILLMDALLNFSKQFLPATRGGKMDAPLVLTTILDPSEIDDEAHAMDTVSQYPLAFYRASENMAAPGEVPIETVRQRLNTPNQYENIQYTHEASMEGVMQTKYVQLKTMQEKVAEELNLMRKIRAVDVQNAAEKIILSHFLPDLYGNLRKFSRQQFRCVDCSAKYRRVPLQGKCRRCGGKILLTINKGGIKKYLELSKTLTDTYQLPLYLKQRLLLIEKEIASIFEDERSKQFSLADYA